MKKETYDLIVADIEKLETQRTITQLAAKSVDATADLKKQANAVVLDLSAQISKLQTRIEASAVSVALDAIHKALSAGLVTTVQNAAIEHDAERDFVLSVRYSVSSGIAESSIRQSHGIRGKRNSFSWNGKALPKDITVNFGKKNEKGKTYKRSTDLEKGTVYANGEELFSAMLACYPECHAVYAAAEQTKFKASSAMERFFRMTGNKVADFATVIEVEEEEEEETE